MKKTLLVVAALIVVLCVPSLSAQSKGASAGLGIAPAQPSRPATLAAKLRSLRETFTAVTPTPTNLDLQQQLAKQQQTLQMLSTISKLLNDAALNTIRRIGG